jgi:hypothetical protein
MLLVDDLLRGLVAIERQTPTSTLHDDCWAETAKDAGLVVLRRVETLDNDIVGIDQRRAASGTLSVGIGCTRQTRAICALGAEDVAFGSFSLQREVSRED